MKGLGMPRYAVWVSVLAVLGCVGSVAAQNQENLSRPGFLIVVHPSNTIPSMTSEAVSDIFLTKVKNWPDERIVEPVNLKPDSPIREAVSNDVIRRSVSNVERYLQKQIFSGQAKPPLVVATEAEVVQFVSRKPGAIGYVSAGFEISGVRILPLMTSPVRKNFVQPKANRLALSARIQGTVVLRVSINVEGKVSNVTPVKELSHGLTTDAVNAVKRWEFEPATLNGEPVETIINVTVRF